jgi:hypothetical protein
MQSYMTRCICRGIFFLLFLFVFHLFLYFFLESCTVLMILSTTEGSESCPSLLACFTRSWLIVAYRRSIA